MPKSMTGYGQAADTLNGLEITVEIRALNHRYLELSLRLPRNLAFLEEKLKPEVQKEVSRGKVEVSVQIKHIERSDVVIKPNIEIARGYVDALRSMSEELDIEFDSGTTALSRFQDIFIVASAEMDETRIFEDVRAVVRRALTGFLAMRETEGKRMADDILEKLSTIEKLVSGIEESSGDMVEKYREKLYQRMKTVLETVDIDENRILLEAALYADKSAVDEEIVRLKSHIAQFRQIMTLREPVGRKLDFLIQELNREINTIGSKSGDLEITGKVVDAKAELEKIRELVQNIE